ncbi:MAG: IS21 family transposase [Vicinamibacterales bacterium]|nr:IS21 family transposase [Vicinamibacterales bacterium]
MVNDKQVKLLRQKRMNGKTQEAAASAANMTARTARKWEKGPLPSQTKRERGWRTREDPFEGVWDEVVVPLLESDKDSRLQAASVLGELQRREPDRFIDGQVRTLQRRMRDWRAVSGPARPVYFEQEHPPGREAAFDFTHCTSLEVTIAATEFPHLLFVLRLSFSKWTWVDLAFGETYEAVVTGLQGALWDLGASPQVVRHDNLSAATHELKRSSGRALNKRFADVLAHYDLRSTRINPGESHENGVVEKANDLVKSALHQALLLRGHRDFPTVDTYMAFVHEVVERSFNLPATERLATERQHLRALPPTPVPNFTVHTPTVRCWSTIRVGGRAYSVPSRLIGHEVTVHQHADVLEVFYKDRLVETMERLRGDEQVRIDYRHVIWSLVKKPGAFARYRHREELFPSLTFRLAYDALTRWHGERADIEYVRVLHLAASTLESAVAEALAGLLSGGERFDYVALKNLVQPKATTVPDIRIPAPDLAAYDRLLGGVR